MQTKRCTKCGEELAEEKTAWIECEPYCTRCGKIISDSDRLERNKIRTRDKQKRLYQETHFTSSVDLRYLLIPLI